MVDSVRIADNRAVEIWRDTTKDQLVFTAEFLESVVEVESGAVAEGDTWNGSAFVPPSIDLVAYANAVQWQKATAGRTVTVAGESRTFATDPISLSLITGKALRLQQPDAPATLKWQFSTGFVEIAAADFIAAAAEIADFVQSTFDTLSTVLADIAGGTVTTTGEIDTAFAGL